MKTNIKKLKLYTGYKKDKINIPESIAKNLLTPDVFLDNINFRVVGTEEFSPLVLCHEVFRETTKADSFMSITADKMVRGFGLDVLSEILQRV